VTERREQLQRILIADDSVVSRRLLQATLEQFGYEVVTVGDGAAAWEELRTPDSPQLAILDWVMPGYTGPEVCRLVRDEQSERYRYLMLLTSRTQKQDLITGMESGADDYITKPFDRQELEVRLRAAVRILQLQNELLAAREALREQATRDSLTKLWNRSTIMDLLSRELSRMEREDSSVGLLMIDIDHFKSVNDTYGHLAGDEVLRQMARRMLAGVRHYDAVGRYGGEEFLVILPGCDLHCIERHADRLRLSLTREPILIGTTELTVTASVGATYAVPACQTTAQTLLRTADDALYEAKRSGRNCTRLIRSELTTA
jgi:diguanylate cyclase (GGDEF)-like protein